MYQTLGNSDIEDFDALGLYITVPVFQILAPKVGSVRLGRKDTDRVYDSRSSSMDSKQLDRGDWMAEIQSCSVVLTSEHLWYVVLDSMALLPLFTGLIGFGVALEKRRLRRKIWCGGEHVGH